MLPRVSPKADTALLPAVPAASALVDGALPLAFAPANGTAAAVAAAAVVVFRLDGGVAVFADDASPPIPAFAPPNNEDGVDEEEEELAAAVDAGVAGFDQAARPPAPLSIEEADASGVVSFCCCCCCCCCCGVDESNGCGCCCCVLVPPPRCAPSSAVVGREPIIEMLLMFACEKRSKRDATETFKLSMPRSSCSTLSWADSSCSPPLFFTGERPAAAAAAAVTPARRGWSRLLGDPPL